MISSNQSSIKTNSNYYFDYHFKISIPVRVLKVLQYTQFLQLFTFNKFIIYRQII